MEFVFFTTKGTKKPERTCRAFSTASAMLIHAALQKTKLPPVSCVSNSQVVRAKAGLATAKFAAQRRTKPGPVKIDNSWIPSSLE